MLAYVSLNNTLEAIGKSSDDQDVWNTLFSFMRMCRIQALVYHYQSPPGSADFGCPVIVKKDFNSSDNPQANYIGQADIVDLLFNKSLQSAVSDVAGEFLWSYTVEALRELFQENPELALVELDEEIKGISFPVHGPLGHSGCFSLVFPQGREGSTEEEIRVLKWACQNTHQALCNIQMREFEDKINLTERETEILSWVVRGKSNTVIADILGISHHTVNTYVRRIFLKTGKADRTSVALLGIYQGLVSL